MITIKIFFSGFYWVQEIKYIFYTNKLNNQDLFWKSVFLSLDWLINPYNNVKSSKFIKIKILLIYLKTYFIKFGSTLKIFWMPRVVKWFHTGILQTRYLKEPDSVCFNQGSVTCLVKIQSRAWWRFRTDRNCNVGNILLSIYLIIHLKIKQCQLITEPIRS